MKTSENLEKILPKLAQVKSKLEAVTKGANNPFFKSKYADLNTHLDAVEPLLQEAGLILLQPCSTSEIGQNRVSTVIVDSVSGQFVCSEMTLVGEKDMQKAGSAITYGRRYTLGSLLSMKAEDDDGNSASGKGNKTNTPKTTTTPSKTAATTAKAASAPAKASGFRTPKNAPETEPKQPTTDEGW